MNLNTNETLESKFNNHCILQGYKDSQLNKKLKRLQTAVIVLAVAICLIGLGCIAKADEFETWYTGAENGLNLRTEPNTNSDVITVYPIHTEVSVIGTDGGDWWEVFDGEHQGWVHKSYMVDSTDKTPEPQGMRYIGDFFCTTYTPDPAENGGSNYTAKGDLLSSVVGYAIAVDPRVIPYNTRVYIEGIGERVARDCGGAIKGDHIDVLAWSNSMSALGGYSTHRVYIME